MSLLSSPESLLLAALCLLVGVGLGAWPFFRRSERLRVQRDALDQELIRLRITHEEKLAALQALQQAFDQSRVDMKTEFQNLASQVLEEKSRVFSQSSQVSLDTLLQPFREQIESFRKRVNEVHDASMHGQARLGAEIRQVLDVGLKMGTQADSLASALKGDKKATGLWGEVQLERSLQLAGLVKGAHYQPQANFRDEAGNRRLPDFVVNLPDGKHLVIDSKVSLVDYDRAVSASTPAVREAALAAHVQAVRRHMDELAAKDYGNLPGMKSPSFVLMFMPIEPAYIEAMRQDRTLFDDGYRRNVILVSHTTLMPILRTVASLWMVARGNEQARALSDMAGNLYNQVATLAERLQKLGGTLQTVGTQYNSVVTALAGQQGLRSKVAHFTELSVRANKPMPDIAPLDVDLDVQRLDDPDGGDPPEGNSLTPSQS